MTREQMIAWLILEGWQLYVWVEAPCWRFVNTPPGDGTPAWFLDDGKWKAGRVSAPYAYHLFELERLSTVELKCFIEALQHQA